MLTLCRHKSAPAALALLALFWAAGPAHSGGVPAPGPEDPTGGQWKPVVLEKGEQISLPAPPVEGSRRQALELRELRALQTRRTEETRATVAFWNAGACLRWNEIARSLVSQYRTPPPQAARVYALLSVAQYDALVAAWHNKYLYERPAPAQVDRKIVPLVATPRLPVYPSEHGAVAGASAAVLAYLYPEEAAALAARILRAQCRGGAAILGACRSDEDGEQCQRDRCSFMSAWCRHNWSLFLFCSLCV